MELPTFRYHTDPVRTGSVKESPKKCRVCRQARGHIYAGPVYAEKELDEAICPWCVADGSAHKKFDATFVDTEAFSDETPEAVIEEISERTPGYAAWQAEQWPMCCGDATRFLGPVGMAEVRADYREWEFTLLNHIIHEMGISGGAATRLLDSLNKDSGPTAYLFQCPKCLGHRCHIDEV